MEESEAIKEEMALLDRICVEAEKAGRVVLFTGTKFAIAMDPTQRPKLDQPIDLVHTEVAL